MSAFPIPELIQDRDGNYSLHCEGGLTKRELFAAMAMQGIVSNAALYTEHGLGPSNVAQGAREFADALLAELEKTP